MSIDTTAAHKKPVTVTINARPFQLEKGDITFEELVQLAFPDGTGGEAQYRVSYRRGEGNKSGTLAAGQSVKVKEGMEFHVDVTNRS
ncbi:multiubiquitin domain-containing protein [Microbacterium rhizosphaerae]|uniref:Multiubiquitin domain-containing protein n=1 Tax=Microbacterium rhizosphaerae TaxID=1678237 RepID=A0ABZ0SNH4_9MICO|nr:multiubiquitin domain-containing protein [Microbacterium rhizosphaerae]WPR90193.1 multiubiquitin domain-containing protein [Microbacterium rhizosphaerae]